eukprot:15395393-Alexandrium_andersonii.AAC.1
MAKGAMHGARGQYRASQGRQSLLYFLWRGLRRRFCPARWRANVCSVSRVLGRHVFAYWQGRTWPPRPPFEERRSTWRLAANLSLWLG